MPTSHSFVNQVAAHYCNQPQLHDFWFVMPNRRAGQFLERALLSAQGGKRILPKIISMPEFVVDMVQQVVVEPTEAIMLLYKAYCDIFADKATPFDHFVYWANIVLTDFNDVDISLVDADKLFTNLRELREISTDYIAPELRSYIGTVLNMNISPTDDGERFWRHSDNADNQPDGEVKKEFMALWEQLAPMYHAFHSLLQQQGLTTLGQAYRAAVKTVGDTAPECFPFHKVVFVGFSNPSNAERVIFKLLDNKQKADFWWDLNSPLLQHPANTAAEAVKHLADDFPPPETFESQAVEQHITTHSVPGNVGQAKLAFSLLNPTTDCNINTAVVLLDEQLLLPVLHSVSNRWKKLNVTMGYPIRLSGIASLMRLVAGAHNRSTHNQRTDRWLFYREDIKDFLSHPLIKVAYTDDALALTADIEQSNEFNIPTDLLTCRQFGMLFTPLADTASVEQVVDYITRLGDFCADLHSRLTPHLNTPVDHADGLHDDNAADDDDTPQQDVPLQLMFIEQYARSLDRLAHCLKKYNLPATDTSLFFLLDRLASGYTVPFSGEPLEGIQIMGMLETRCLDFDKVVILSMNERVYPKRHTTNSFIAADLRAAYGMPTPDRMEAAETYHFYRLIGRAREVHLIYNNNTQAVGSSEPSRFIAQMEMVFGIKVMHRIVDLPLSVSKPLEIKAPKDERLQLLCNSDLVKRLSASSINEYISCPFKFYLHHVERLSDDNEQTDFMDYGTFGTIVHDTLNDLYYPPMPDGTPRTGEPIRITKKDIQIFKAEKMRQTITRNINRVYYRRPDDRLDEPLTGEAMMTLETIEAYVNKAITIDLNTVLKDNDYIDVLECEQPHVMQLTVGRQTVNFTYKPDRVDRVGNMLRIIDYKTGKDTTKFGCGVDALFAENPDRPHAIAQLLLYCNAWQQEHHDTNEPIRPMVYKLRAPDETGVFYKPTEGRNVPYIDYVWTADDEVNQLFLNKMEEKLNELFDLQKPFLQTTSDKPCRWCHFTEFCRRTPNKDN